MNTTVESGGHQVSIAQQSRQSLDVPLGCDQRRDSPEQGQRAGDFDARRGGHYRRRRTKGGQDARRLALARDCDDGIRLPCRGQRDRRVAESPAVPGARRIAGRRDPFSGQRLGLANHSVEHFDRTHRKQAGRGLTREHDGVGAFHHGIGGIAHLRARRPRLGAHRLEHLSGDDHWSGPRPRKPDDLLLHARHTLESHFQAEIAASDHDALGDLENRGQVVHRRRALDLGDERHHASRRCGDRSRAFHILGGLNEAERHKVHPELEAEAQILLVLGSDRGRRKRNARRVDALLAGERAAVDDDGHQLGRRRAASP